MAQVIDSAAEELRAGFGGTVLDADHSEYDTARSVWNGAIDRRPALIARCTSPADVARAIEVARSRGLEVCVRGGGHNFAGNAVIDGALMIDLSPLHDVTIDVDGRRAVVGGGATWAQLDAAAQEHALATPGGFISHTGIGGLTLGGGMGHLTRKHGLSIDNLLGADVVTADGRRVHASESENSELFWALRGGGGNFGVVTSFEFRLHEVGPMVQLGLFFWPAAQAVEALQVSREIIADLPEDIAPFLGGLSLPPAPFVPEEHHGDIGFALILSGFGAEAEHAAASERVRSALKPLVELVTPIPYVALQQMFDEGAPWGIHGYEKAHWLPELSDGVIAVLAEHLPRKQSPLSFIPTFILDGAYARVADADTAFAGARRPMINLNIGAVAPTRELYEADREWVRNLWDALAPFAPTSGSYVNFMSEYNEDRVVASYGREKYDRLARIKAEYDPDNVFRHNMNIKPASPASV